MVIPKMATTTKTVSKAITGFVGSNVKYSLDKSKNKLTIEIENLDDYLYLTDKGNEMIATSRGNQIIDENVNGDKKEQLKLSVNLYRQIKQIKIKKRSK